jgi:hypothetical protein
LNFENMSLFAQNHLWKKKWWRGKKVWNLGKTIFFSGRWYSGPPPKVLRGFKGGARGSAGMWSRQVSEGWFHKTTIPDPPSC